MGYTPTVWVNGGTPAINATNLNHMETQYAQALADIPEDQAAGTPSERTLGTGALQAAAGDHLHAIVNSELDSDVDETPLSGPVGQAPQMIFDLHDGIGEFSVQDGGGQAQTWTNLAGVSTVVGGSGEHGVVIVAWMAYGIHKSTGAGTANTVSKLRVEKDSTTLETLTRNKSFSSSGAGWSGALGEFNTLHSDLFRASEAAGTYVYNIDSWFDGDASGNVRVGHCSVGIKTFELEV